MIQTGTRRSVLMSIHYCQVINYIIYISKSLSHQFRVIFKHVQRVHWSKLWTPKTLLSCPSHLVWSAGPANWPTWLKPYPCPPSHRHSLNKQSPQGRQCDKGHHRDHGYHGHQLKNQRNATAFSNRHQSNNEIQLAVAKI